MESGLVTFPRGFSQQSFESLTLVDLLRSRALNQANQLAYTFLPDGEAGEINLTYGELDRQARAIAATLQDVAASGARALLLYPPGLEFISAFFGCLYASVVAVPAYPARNIRGVPRLRAIVKDGQATLAMTTASIRSLAGNLFAQAPDLETLDWLATDAVDCGAAEYWKQQNAGGDTLAFLQYTSGSTGTPKGVMLSHENLLQNADLVFQAVEHTQNDRYVSWLPTFHDMGFMAGVLQPLYAGIPAVLMSPVSFLQRPYQWLQTISEYKGTTSGGPNFAYDLCVRKISDEQKQELDLSSWSVAFNGAEPIRSETLDRFAAAFAPCGFRRETFFPCYGLAEATLIVSGGRKSDEPLIKKIQSSSLEHDVAAESVDAADDARTMVSCGKSLGAQDVAIVDTETFTRRQPGEVGEIWVSGRSVAQGYWNRPEETERTFKAYIADSCEGPYLRTGDLGFMHDGELFVAGRLKDLIIIRGRNHYPQDIELTVERTHPALRAGCGAAFSIDVAGEERLVVVQEVELRHQPDFNEVISSIRQRVAENHELQIHAVSIIKGGTIPKTSSGKIQRHASKAAFLKGTLEALAEWRANGPSDDEPLTAAFEGGFETVDDIQRWLVSQLASKLKLNASEIDISQPIGRYGVDSLMDIELVHSTEAELGVTLPVLSFLQGASVAELARQVLSQLTQPSTSEIPLRAAERDEQTEYPLSRGQQALWFLHNLAPESAAYNIGGAVRIPMAVDVTALARAFQSLVDRHAALRTSFTAYQNSPAQCVHDRADVRFLHEDVSSWTEEELSARLIEESHRPFDLEQDSLLRVNLFSRSDNEHVLLLTVHHIVADFWSLSVLLKELGLFYSAELSGVPASLPALTLRYTDYVRWQETRLIDERGEQLWNYWQSQLAGELPVLNLSTDRPRPRVQTYQGDSRGLSLSYDLSQSLKAIARDSGATLYTVLLAAFEALLYRYTGQEDILLGTPTSGRGNTQLQPLVGYFVNPVVVRADVSGQPTFDELLTRAWQTVLSAFEHQDYPFPLLVERLQPQRDPGLSPLFQVMFVLQKVPLLNEQGLEAFALGEDSARIKLGALTLESVRLDRQVAQFDLTLKMAETENGLAASLQYNTDLFDDETITRMLAHFEILLEGVALNPQQKISDLPLLSETERNQLLVEWNDTSKEFGPEQTLNQLVEAQAERTPEAVAVVFEREQISYQELNSRANKVANYLRAKGIGPEVRVGICAERSIELIVGLLGIVKAGGAYVPLDPAYPKQRLAFIIEDSQPQILLAQNHLADLVSNEQIETLLLDRESEIFQADSNQVESLASAENLAYIIYTSGSTGRPKGVMISHGAIVNHLNWRQTKYPLKAGDSFLQKASFGFDISVWEIFGTLMSGARLVLAGPGEEKDSQALVKLIREEEITVIHFGPAMLDVFINEEGVEECRKLRRIYCGGESLRAELKKRVEEKLDVELYHQYGPTEATVDATIGECRRGEEERRIAIGRPIANTEVYILDKGMRLVPAGVAGEIYIGGEGVARGYLNRGDLTAERFVANPYGKVTGARLYKTGDKGRYRRDGSIEYLGREDEQVKVRGYRIELGEIEAMLAGEEGVREAVVVVREEEGGEKRIVGYVVKEVGAEVREEELKRSMREKVPEYMVPGVIVELEEMPLNANGKVDRKALPAPDDIRSPFDFAYVGPRTPIEQILAGVWEQVLRRSQVASYDNFFDLGGNSLLATQVMSQVRKIFEVDLPLRAIFERPALNDLAEVIEGALEIEQGWAAHPITPAQREGNAPLSFAQQRLWFIDQFDPGSSAYNMPGAIELKGALDVQSLERSLNEIIRRHESLRTTFAVSGASPVQVIAEELSIKLSVCDIRDFSSTEQEAYLSETSINESRKPFDLSQGPLLRTRLVRLSIDRHMLFLTMHHIVSDGWSLDVFLRELVSLYESFSTGRPSRLHALPIQYADFARWQRERLQGDALDTALSYWRQQLGGELPVLQLPSDRPRSATPTANGAKESTTLPKSLSESLKALSRREGVTLFMTFVAAFKSLLHRYSGQEDIILGTPIANRNRAETEGLIGFFVNTLILRTDLSGDPSFRRLLARVRETAMDAYTHQDFPFEKLVEELQPERDAGTNPLFQAMISLQNSQRKEFELPGLTLTPVATGEFTTKFIDLVLDVTETEGGLITTLEYSTDLFDSSTIQRMLGHLETMLAGITNNPDTRLSELPLLTESEQEQILVRWNDTFVEYAHDLCLHQLVEANAAIRPDAVAVISEGDQISYKELNERSNQLANYLRSFGVGRETLVGICAERSIELVVGMLGILKAGGAYVPLDPEYPKDRLASILEDAQVSVQLIQERLLDRFPEYPAPFICLDRDWQEIAKESTENVNSGVTADDLAFVLYTSGSTGKPKGVMISHKAAGNHIFWIQHRFPMDETDSMPMKYSICFDASVFEIFYTLHAGARLIMVRQGMQQDLVYLVNLMHEHKITVLDLVGAQLQVLMDDERFLQCHWLRRVSCGNDGMLAEVKERFFKEMGKELIHFYGPCETSIGSTCHTCQPGGDHQVVSIGRPISNTQVYVLDSNLRPSPIGVAGEIVIGGIGVTCGYLKRPDATAEKFVPNPFATEPGDRLYRTGDLGRYRPDGTLEFAGRLDHQVKIRGFRIELGDIEAALKDHPAIQEVIVLARSDDEITDRQATRVAIGSDGQVDLKALAEQARLLNAESVNQLLAEIEALSEIEAGSLLRAEGLSAVKDSSGGDNSKGDFEIALPLQGEHSINQSQEAQRS